MEFPLQPNRELQASERGGECDENTLERELSSHTAGRADDDDDDKYGTSAKPNSRERTNQFTL